MEKKCLPLKGSANDGKLGIVMEIEIDISFQGNK